MSWVEYNLNELGGFKNGLNFKKEKMGSGYPLINVKDITSNIRLSSKLLDLVDVSIEGNSASYLAERGDIFFVRSSVKREGVGMVGMLDDDEKTVHCGFVIRFRPNQKIIHPKFLLYLLSSPYWRESVRNLSGGTAIINISQGALKTLNIKFPESLQIQKRIADILSAYDDLIENNLKRIKLLEQAAQNIYKEWFVNLRFPGNENTPINEETDLPYGWVEKSLGDIISKLESGSRPKGGIDKSLKKGVPSIGAESVRRLGYFDFSKTKYIKEVFFDKMRKGILEDRDILIYKDGAYIGRSTLFQDNFPFKKCSINEHIFLIHAKDELLQYYLYFTLHSYLYFEKMQSLNSNAAQPGINQKKIRTLPIICPSTDLLNKFDSMVTPMVRKIYKLAKMNLKLKTGRDILLPRLMNSTIEV